MKRTYLSLLVAGFIILQFGTVRAYAAPTQYAAVDLTDEQVENIVRRLYRFVVLYKVNNKFALDDSGPMYIDGLIQSQKHK